MCIPKIVVFVAIVEWGIRHAASIGMKHFDVNFMFTLSLPKMSKEREFILLGTKLIVHRDRAIQDKNDFMSVFQGNIGMTSWLKCTYLFFILIDELE